MRIEGPRFWGALAAFTAFGTLALAIDIVLAKPLGIPDAWHYRFSIPLVSLVLSCSILGFGTMWLGGRDTGTLVVRGRPLARKRTRSLCTSLYLLPWIVVLLLMASSQYRI